MASSLDASSKFSTRSERQARRCGQSGRRSGWVLMSLRGSAVPLRKSVFICNTMRVERRERFFAHLLRNSAMWSTCEGSSCENYKCGASNSLRQLLHEIREGLALPGSGLAGREVKLETISAVLRQHVPSAGEQKGNLIPITRRQRLFISFKRRCCSEHVWWLDT